MEKINTYYFKVADLFLELTLPVFVDVASLLPSFAPFRCLDYEEKAGELCMRIYVSDVFKEHCSESVFINDAVNDMGHVCLYEIPEGYKIEIKARHDSFLHYMISDRRFTNLVAAVNWNDKYVGQVISSLIRMAFSQAVLEHDAVSVHASAVFIDGQAYMFMGKSGTGKSTHASLWIKNFYGCDLLNDDNPVVRVKDTGVWIYGTPWSGKTQCYKNLSFPLKGAVLLKQAAINRFFYCKEIKAFVTLLPSCSVIREDEYLHNCLCDILVKIIDHITVGTLDCLPNREAAVLCKEKLKN